jgi:hypothetical protein
MKLTRRQLVIAAAAAPAIVTAQTTTAQENLKRNADALAKLAVPISTEPAFQFKA